jgi:hypothetical protein
MVACLEFCRLSPGVQSKTRPKNILIEEFESYPTREESSRVNSRWRLLSRCTLNAKVARMGNGLGAAHYLVQYLLVIPNSGGTGESLDAMLWALA